FLLHAFRRSLSAPRLSFLSGSWPTGFDRISTGESVDVSGRLDSYRCLRQALATIERGVTVIPSDCRPRDWRNESGVTMPLHGGSLTVPSTAPEGSARAELPWVI